MTDSNAEPNQPGSAPPDDHTADVPMYTTPPPQVGVGAPPGPYASPSAPPSPGPATGSAPPVSPGPHSPGQPHAPGQHYPPGVPYPTDPAQASEPQQRSGQSGATAPPATLWWGIASTVTMLAAVSIPEGGSLGWTAYPAWAVVMVLAAVTTMVPVIADGVKMKPELAWRISAGAAGTLLALWVLFTLPTIHQNTALLATIATVTGVLAAVAAPGRPASLRHGDADRPDEW